MALVRRTPPPAVGRAAVPRAETVIPQQGGVVPAAVPPVPGLENAAAVPSPPAKAWAMLVGLGLTGAGGFLAWDINTFMAPTQFQAGDQWTTFLTMFVIAAAVERILEPFTRWLPGRTEQERYERALADLDNGVPGAMNAAAHYKASLDSARSSRAVLTWGLATLIATVLSAGAGFYLLRGISADPGWHAVPAWADALVTGLIVGSGTKPLHDLLVRFQGQRQQP